jgi:16S rRNA (guanine1516-N2)-methyltransferase
MQLLNADGRLYLKDLPSEACPAVVYLDPMYPYREKSAKVKKEMQLLQRLLGGDPDSAELLEAARKVARNRVVVKRPAKAEPLGGLKPSLAIHSPNTRYDIYLTGTGNAAV